MRSWGLAGAASLGDEHQIGAWLLQGAEGWALAGAPIETASRLRRAGTQSAVRAIIILDSHPYSFRDLAQTAALTGAPAYAHPEALPFVEGSRRAVDQRSLFTLLKPVADLVAGVRGPMLHVQGVRPLEPHASPREATQLRLLPLEGLAPGAAMLLDEQRGYLVAGPALTNAGGRIRLAPRREVRDAAAFRRSLLGLLDRPLEAVLCHIGPPITGAEIDRLRSLLGG